MRITDFQQIKYKHERGHQMVRCDAFGNNVAFACLKCGHPMLAVIRDNQRGSDAMNPAVCRSCDFRCWLEPEQKEMILHLYVVSWGRIQS